MLGWRRPSNESPEMRAAHLFLAFALLALAACSKPTPPPGKWEGGTERGGVVVVARVEILPSGLVRVMAPDVTNAPAQQIPALRERLAADLANGWPDVAPREM